MGKNTKKNEQLGMPYGTANNKLKKQILFAYIQRCEDNVCYRCGEKIENIENFSIDHKVPWLDNSPDLFWDLDNIAFSHLSCNAGAGRRRSKQNITVVCNYCGQEFERAKYNVNSSIKKGYKNTYCSLSCSAKGAEPWKLQKRNLGK